MSTNFVHRLVVVTPAAKAATVATWMNANLVTGNVPADLGPGLSPSGNAPATYNWCSIALVDSDCKAVLAKLCQLAAVTPPTNAQWNGWTPAQKISWLVSVRAAILSGYGVYVTLSINDGVWDDPVAALNANGLQVVATTGVI